MDPDSKKHRINKMTRTFGLVCLVTSFIPGWKKKISNGMAHLMRYPRHARGPSQFKLQIRGKRQDKDTETVMNWATNENNDSFCEIRTNLEVQGTRFNLRGCPPSLCENSDKLNWHQ
jgi:hypothetical protein